MHLARTVEHTVDVDEMLSRMTPQQFDEWQSLYDLEPWGDDWSQAARIEAAIRNANRGDCEPIGPADIIPTAENLKKNRTDEVPDENLGAIWKQRLGF